MRLADIYVKFAVALAFLGAGIAPIAIMFPSVLHVVGGLADRGGAWTSAFVNNYANFGTSSLVILACILSFACGFLLAVVSFGRTLEFVRASSAPRGRGFTYLTR